MKVLLDEMLPIGVRELVPGHEVSTAGYAGLAGLPNGELIRRAVEASFDVIVTLDRGIPQQQNVRRHGYMTIEIPDSMLPLKGDMEHRIVHGSLPELTHEQVDSHILDLQTRGVLPMLAQSMTAGDPHRLSTQMTPFGRRFASWVEATSAELLSS